MASGETIAKWKPQDNEPPAADFATRDSRNSHPVLDFAIDEIGVFSDVLSGNYAGTTGLTAYLHFAMSSAEADDVKLEGYFERIGDSQQNLDADGFAGAQNTGDITVPGSSGDVDIVPIVFADGAEMDSIAVGEGFRFKVIRIAVTGDDATGDLELRFIEIKET